MTVSIEVKNATVNFPLLGSDSRSLKRSTLNSFGIGGKLSGEFRQVKALDDISISVKKGQKVCLTGHNGSGKSTLLRLICGIYEADEGSVLSKGKMVCIFDAGTSVDRELNGRENIQIMLLNYLKIPSLEAIEKVKEFSELEDFFELPVKTYSNGMFARLVYSIITCLDFEILILDEEIGMADKEFLAKIQLEITKKLGSHGILLFASHDTKIQRSFLNRRLQLDGGKIISDEIFDYNFVE